MAGITLEIAEKKLTLYMAAEDRILEGQEVVIDGRRLTRANLDEVKAGVEIWNSRVQRLSRSGCMQLAEVIPR